MQPGTDYEEQKQWMSAQSNQVPYQNADGTYLPQDYYGLSDPFPPQGYAYTGMPAAPDSGYQQPYPPEPYQEGYLQQPLSQQPYVPSYPQAAYSQEEIPGNNQGYYPQQGGYVQGYYAPDYGNGAVPDPMMNPYAGGIPVQNASVQEGIPAEQPKAEPKKKLFQGNSSAKEKRERKPLRMPSPKGILRIGIILAVLALLTFVVLRFVFGVGKKTSALIETGIYESSHIGDVLIVRNETVYSDESVQDIDYISEEGAAVNRGNIICYVYSTNYTTKEANSLQNYRDAIRDYENILLSKATSYDAKMNHLETQLVETALQIRQLVQGSKGNLLNQEVAIANAITERQDYFKSQYPSDLTLIRNFDNETTQQQKIDSWIQSKTAMQDGIVSFYTDGFENELSPTLYTEYTPSQVKRMLNGEHLNTTAASRGRTNLYRVVQQGNYAVLMLMQDTNFEPHEGVNYKLVMEQFGEKQLDVQVISYTRSGGDLLLRLAVMGDVKDVLYLRSCKASLSEFTNCVIVPQSALYRKDNIQGVVMLIDNQQWFVPVNVLHKRDGKAYIEPVQNGILSEGAIVKLY